jgi:hypothetical protein
MRFALPLFAELCKERIVRRDQRHKLENTLN